MSKTNTLENEYLLLMFNNANIGSIGDVTGLRGSTTAGSFFLSLHTSDPAEGGSQTTNEVAYTSYARVAIARSGAGFTVTGNAVATAAATSFPACTGGGPVNATHWGLGTDSSGAGKLLYKGALSATIAITASPSVTPRVAAGTMVTED